MHGVESSWYERKEFVWVAALWNRLPHGLSPVKHVPPNLVTLFGAVLVPPMAIAFLVEGYLCGAICFAIGLLTDSLDGTLARYQAREADEGRLEMRSTGDEWLQLGPTRFGTWLDPAADKFRYFSALLPLGWHLIGNWIIIAAGLAIGLTFFRIGVRALWNLEPGSNIFGKIKVGAEAVVIASLIGVNLGFAIGTPSLLLFLAATALAAVSLCLQGLSAYRHVRAIERQLGRQISFASFFGRARLVRNHLRDRKP